MKKYYVMFYNGNEKVCGTWKQAENEEQACLFAEITLICKYPNVRYTKVNHDHLWACVRPDDTVELIH